MATCSVFISYHHNDEQAVVDHFIETLCEACDVVTDRSPERAADSGLPKTSSYRIGHSNARVEAARSARCSPQSGPVGTSIHCQRLAVYTAREEIAE